MRTSRRGLAGLIGLISGGFLARQSAKAQTTAQEILNDLEIVSTGDVHVGQRAAGTQHIYTDSRGNRYYAHDTVQAVENDGRVVATGDVWVEQEAAAEQVTTPVEVPRPGQVCIQGLLRYGALPGEHDSHLMMQGADCEWHVINLCELVSICYGK